MTKPSTDRETGSLNNPAGVYAGVSVRSLQHEPGALSDGTGDLSAISVFSAGPFADNDLPKIGTYYNMSGTHDGTFYQFPRWICITSARTSQFRAQ